MSELSRIRQVVFLIENRVYKFDVNSQTNIKNLRKMISAAANISNKVFKFTQNNKEINAPESTTLDQLFPQEELIEINVCSIKKKGCEPSPINLKQGLSCEYHIYKFPYLYCYDCLKSICSMCVQSEEHRNHNFIDKHDYLQNSEILVSTIFQDMTKLLANLTNDKKLELEAIKTKISKKLIPNLIDQIKSVETKLIEIINYFLTQIDKNKDVLYSNSEILKNLCSDGLEELKYQLKIQDIMIDEDIFITIDEKIKEISKEKDRILGDRRKYEEILNTGNLINTAVESVYSDISVLIDKKLRSFFQEEFKQKVLLNVVSNITKDEIYHILFSDFKKIPKSPTGANLTAFSCEKFKLNSSEKKIKKISESGLKINLMSTFEIDKNTNQFTIEDTKQSNRQIISNVLEEYPNIVLKDIDKSHMITDSCELRKNDRTDVTKTKTNDFVTSEIKKDGQTINSSMNEESNKINKIIKDNSGSLFRGIQDIDLEKRVTDHTENALNNKSPNFRKTDDTQGQSNSKLESQRQNLQLSGSEQSNSDIMMKDLESNTDNLNSERNDSNKKTNEETLKNEEIGKSNKKFSKNSKKDVPMEIINSKNPIDEKYNSDIKVISRTPNQEERPDHHMEIKDDLRKQSRQKRLDDHMNIIDGSRKPSQQEISEDQMEIQDDLRKSTQNAPTDEHMEIQDNSGKTTPKERLDDQMEIKEIPGKPSLIIGSDNQIDIKSHSRKPSQQEKLDNQIDIKSHSRKPSQQEKPDNQIDIKDSSRKPSKLVGSEFPLEIKDSSRKPSQKEKIDDFIEIKDSSRKPSQLEGKFEHQNQNKDDLTNVSGMPNFSEFPGEIKSKTIDNQIDKNKLSNQRENIIDLRIDTTSVDTPTDKSKGNFIKDLETNKEKSNMKTKNDLNKKIDISIENPSKTQELETINEESPQEEQKKENELKNEEVQNIDQDEIEIDLDKEELFENIKESNDKIEIKNQNKHNFDQKFTDKILREIEKNRHEDEEDVEILEKENTIINLIPNSNEMYVYKDYNTVKIKKKTIDFPRAINMEQFPENCSHSNYKNKIYITGGKIDDKECKMVFLYDNSINKTIRLSDMNVPRINHSSMIHNDNLYVIGGTNNKTIERYSLLDYKWTRIGSMNQERERPIVIIRDNYLYIFFGVDKNGVYSNTVERINIITPFSKPENVAYSNDDEIQLGLIGCGFIRHRPDEAFFLGGEYMNLEKSKTGFYFNFDNHEFKPAEIVLEEGLFFSENELQEIGKDKYGNFNYDEHFFQIDI